jgi:maltose O-acetyltransferase
VGTGCPLSIGADTWIGHDVLIAGSYAAIEIGAHVDIAPRVTILSGTHEIDMLGPHSAGRGSCLPIIIEDGVWIGGASLVLPGVRIGKKAVIGAGSVVTKDIPAYCIAVGDPCRPVRQWEPAQARWVSVKPDSPAGTDATTA